MKNVNGDTKAIWWYGDDSHQIDFTKPEAANWFSARVGLLKENPGVDSFKFDAGETDYAIPVRNFISIITCNNKSCWN